MSKCGFVYALVTVSSPNLIKVGKTSKNPQDRADELSRATGVATPFVVAFKRLFEDASRAEAFVHAFFEARGHRVAANREFFSAPLEEVVEAILAAPGALDISEAAKRLSEDLSSHCEASGVAPWQSLLDEAEACHYGLGDYLEDHQEAIRLYEKAKTLGAAVRIDPRCAFAYNNRGLWQFRRGSEMRQGNRLISDIENAISDYSKAIEIDSSYAAAYGNRGLAHLRKGRDSEAAADFQKCFQLQTSLCGLFERWANEIQTTPAKNLDCHHMGATGAQVRSL